MTLVKNMIKNDEWPDETVEKELATWDEVEKAFIVLIQDAVDSAREDI